jgi:hypothetical protein
MEPWLVTLPKDRAVLEELKRREPIFHRLELMGSRADLEAMTAEDFWEIGASGRRYSRTYVLETLAGRGQEPLEDRWETRDFYCRELARDLYQLSYTLLQGQRKTRRTTLWQRTATGWRILFHQGTVVQGEGSSA